MPEAGDSFQVVTDTVKAKQIVLYREAKAREQSLAKSSRVTLEQLHKQMEAGEVKDLNIILKTDVGGSAEVLSDTLQKLSNDKVRIRVLRSGVGAITESDVLLASTSNAIVIGFNVRPECNAAAVAEQEKDDVSEVRSGMECGISLENFGDIKRGDVIEGSMTERVVGEVA